MDTVLLVLGIVFGVFIALLVISAVVMSLSNFNSGKRQITGEMRRAFDDEEYNYWHRELRCHYLCLIPFVNGRNVMHIYNFFFNRSQRGEKKRGDGLFHLLAPSVIGALLCVVCLCGASWAWFSAYTSTGETVIKSSEYNITAAVRDSENSPVEVKNNACTVADGVYKVTLSAKGSQSATGYCRVEIGGKIYYTEQITAVGSFTFTIKTTGSSDVEFVSKWGSCAVRTKENTIVSGAEISVIGTVTQAESEPPADKLEPETTEPTTAAPPLTTAPTPTTTAPALTTAAPTPPTTAPTPTTTAPVPTTTAPAPPTTAPTPTTTAPAPTTTAPTAAAPTLIEPDAELDNEPDAEPTVGEDTEASE